MKYDWIVWAALAVAGAVLIACVIVAPQAAIPTALLFVTTVISAFRGKALEEKKDSADAPK